MKKILLIIIFCFFSNQRLLAQNEVKNIRIQKNKDAQRIVIDTTKKTNYNSFVLKNPYRLVIDLNDTNSSIQANSFKANNIIDTLRIGQFSNKDIRLVFDLNIKVEILKSFYLPPTDDFKYHRIVIDLKYNEDDLTKEDLISEIIEKNNLYDSDYLELNNLINEIYANEDSKDLNQLINDIYDNETKNKYNTKINKFNTDSKDLNQLINDIYDNETKNKKSTTNKNSVDKGKITKNPKKHISLNISKPNISYNKKPTIIIDPGHGGKDPGAIGIRGTKEKVITLLYAKALKKKLDSIGKYNVSLTRNKDYFVELRDRVSIARKYKGDLFISIHCNSSTNNNARGFFAYILSQTASDTRTAELAENENKSDILGGVNLYGEYQYTINTLVDISRKQAMNDSKKYARMLVKELKRNKIVKSEKNVINSANFAVLISPDMPSILLEIGFISNIKDEKMIKTNNYRDKVIDSISKSIDNYFSN